MDFLFNYPQKLSKDYKVVSACDQLINTIETENGVFEIFLSDYIFDTMTIEVMNRFSFSKDKETINAFLEEIDRLKFVMFSCRRTLENNSNSFAQSQKAIEEQSNTIASHYIELMKEFINV